MQPADSAENRRDNAVPGTVGIGAIYGVPIRLHFTFVFLLLFLLVVGIGARQTALTHVLYIFGLFVSVLLHELGHALVSKKYGIRTKEIIMFPIGGVARLERTPPPRQELWIALAGPLVNLFLMAAILLFLFSRAALHQMNASVAELLEPTDTNLLERIALGNLILCVFNLLPAFPMDGGRVLRSILAMRRPEEEATRIAARAGRILAILMGLYGLLSQEYMLLFVAFFVYLGAAQESAAAMGRMLTQGVPARAAMITDFQTLAHGASIRDAANLLLSTSQQDFPVVHGSQVVGLLGRNALLRAMATDGPDSYVAGAMERDFIRVAPDVNLNEVLPMLSRAASCALVMDGDRLLGMLTTDNLSEFLVLRRFGMAVRG